MINLAQVSPPDIWNFALQVPALMVFAWVIQLVLKHLERNNERQDKRDEVSNNLALKSIEELAKTREQSSRTETVLKETIDVLKDR